jgi:hypothetical protein
MIEPGANVMAVDPVVGTEEDAWAVTALVSVGSSSGFRSNLGGDRAYHPSPTVVGGSEDPPLLERDR